MSVITDVISFIETCPTVDGAEIAVDMTQKTPDGMSVSQTSESILAKYLDGSRKVELTFTLFVKRYLDHNKKREQTAQFLDDFKAWVLQQNKKRNLPVLHNGNRALKIEAQEGTLYNTNQDDSGIYEVLFRLTYFQKG